MTFDPTATPFPRTLTEGTLVWGTEPTSPTFRVEGKVVHVGPVYEGAEVLAYHVKWSGKLSPHGRSFNGVTLCNRSELHTSDPGPTWGWHRKPRPLVNNEGMTLAEWTAAATCGIANVPTTVKYGGRTMPTEDAFDWAWADGEDPTDWRAAFNEVC